MNIAVSLLALAPQHTMDSAPILLHTLVSMALESINDGREVGDLNMVLGVSADIDDGRIAVRHVMAYQTLDAIICFGATAKSVGFGKSADVAEPTLIRFRQQLKPVAVLRLPAVHSGAWRTTETMFQAASAIKALLLGMNSDGDMLRPDVSMAIEGRDLN